jgi:DNA helicase-2/ATP-dependent DNA helicase PcrA
MKRSARPFHWILGNQSLEKAGDVPAVPKPDKVNAKQAAPDEIHPEAQNMQTRISEMTVENERIRLYRSYENPALPPLPINASPYQFGDRPKDSLLAIPPHEKFDLTIRKAQKRKNGLRLESYYGVLWVIPVTSRIIRIVFEKDCINPLENPPCIGTTGCSPAWSGKITAQDIELETDALRVCIGKKSGAIRFYTKDGHLLLSEQEQECRLIHKRSGRMWNLFAFDRQERIRALGPGKLTMPQLRNNAFYLSHGQKPLRLPCLFSDKGYALAIAASGSVLGCTIPVYGSYFCTEGEEKLDYYFIQGNSEEELHAAYRYLSGNRPQNTGTVKKKGRPSL